MLYIYLPQKISFTSGKNWIKFKSQTQLIIKKKNFTTLFFNKNNNKLYLLLKNWNKQNLKIYYNIINNIHALKNNFILKLRLIGIGFKIDINKNLLKLKLGFSHLINYELPKQLKFIQPKPRIPIYCIIGHNYNIITQIGANLRQLKKPEPYKGKGFRYYFEKIKRKEGKKNYV